MQPECAVALSKGIFMTGSVNKNNIPRHINSKIKGWFKKNLIREMFTDSNMLRMCAGLYEDLITLLNVHHLSFDDANWVHVAEVLLTKRYPNIDLPTIDESVLSFLLIFTEKKEESTLLLNNVCVNQFWCFFVTGEEEELRMYEDEYAEYY
jgi:hypothetical protein